MLVAVCSVKGSPGVTTLALMLAARWPDPEAACLVVEADPAGGDVAARFALPATPGLVSLAAAARRDTGQDLVWRHTQALPGGLQVVTAPVGADQARAALTTLDDGDALRLAGAADQTVVVVDCGRVDPGSPALPLVGAADRVLVLARAHAADLAHVAARLPVITRAARQVQVLLLGREHSPAEVERELGVTVQGVVPDDRRGASAVTGVPMPRSWRIPWAVSGRRLARAAARIAASLVVPEPATAAMPVLAPGGWDADRASDRSEDRAGSQNGQPGRHP